MKITFLLCLEGRGSRTGTPSGAGGLRPVGQVQEPDQRDDCHQERTQDVPGDQGK